MGVRLPTILGKAIEDVVVTLNQEYEEDKIVDLLGCIERMEDLMEDLQGNARIRAIVDDGEGDIPQWNKVGLFPPPLSFRGAWLGVGRGLIKTYSKSQNSLGARRSCPRRGSLRRRISTDDFTRPLPSVGTGPLTTSFFVRVSL